MSTTATGSFDITMTPEEPYETSPTVSLGRVSIKKEFHGDLDAKSTLAMLSAMSTVKGSAGYVAIERVVGSLHGKRGSFVLQHSGTMDRGRATLVVSVVPDSGADELKGLSGRMAIEIVDGHHRYTFEYTLA